MTEKSSVVEKKAREPYTFDLYRLIGANGEEEVKEKISETISWAKEQIEKIKNFKGRISTQDTVKELFSFLAEIKPRIDDLILFADFAKLSGSEIGLETELLEEISLVRETLLDAESFIEPELSSLSEANLKDLSSGLPDGASIIVENIVRFKPYSVSPLDAQKESEKRLLVEKNIDKVFDLARTSPREMVKFSDTPDPVNATDAICMKKMTSSNRDDRKKAFLALMGFYTKYSDDFALLLESSRRCWLDIANSRNFNSEIELEMFKSNLPADFLENFVKTSDLIRNCFKRYGAIKSKILNIDDGLKIWDSSASVCNNFDIGFQDMIGLIEKTHKEIVAGELGETVIKIVDLVSGNFDALPRKGKTPTNQNKGSYNYGGFALVNFLGTVPSYASCWHEIYHAAQKFITAKYQPYHIFNTYNMATLEIPSSIGECLGYISLIRNSSNKQERIDALNFFLSKIFSMLFDTLTDIEFEAIISCRCREGKKFNSEFLNKSFLNIIRKNNSGIDVPQEWGVNWARKIALHYPAYNFNYRLGYMIGLPLAIDIYDKKINPEIITDIFKDWGSINPDEIFRKLGIDITSKEWAAKISGYIDDLISELEKLIVS